MNPMSACAIYSYMRQVASAPVNISEQLLSLGRNDHGSDHLRAPPARSRPRRTAWSMRHELKAATAYCERVNAVMDFIFPVIAWFSGRTAAAVSRPCAQSPNVHMVQESEASTLGICTGKPGAGASIPSKQISFARNNEYN
jgi:hypothetical protein